jgi:hypothetical protein
MNAIVFQVSVLDEDIGTKDGPAGKKSHCHRSAPSKIDF